MLNKKQDGGDHDHQTPPDPYDPFLDSLDLGEEESESEAEAEAESEDDVVIVDDITVDSGLNSSIEDFGSILDGSEEVMEEKEDIALKDGIENVARSLEGATEGDHRGKDAKDVAGTYDLKAGKKEEFFGSDDKKKERIIVNDDNAYDCVTKDDNGANCKDMEDVSGRDGVSLNIEDLSMKMKKCIPKNYSVENFARCSHNLMVSSVPLYSMKNDSAVIHHEVTASTADDGFDNTYIDTTPTTNEKDLVIEDSGVNIGTYVEDVNTTNNEDVVLPMDLETDVGLLNDGSNQNPEIVTVIGCDNEEGEPNGGMKMMDAFERDGGGIIKNEDDGSDEWQAVQMDLMSCESESGMESSDDDFSFGLDEEINEEITYGLCNEVPSIVKAFDIDLLRDCIEKGEESLEDIEGKDVILIVGKTGTGKSSFIQGIAGKTFKSSLYICNEDNMATQDAFEAQDPVSGFEIGHAKSSMTKHIKCFLRSSEKSKRANIYLDTPGLEDTSGEEQDIATSAMLNQVSKKCRSLRFVIIINYVSLLEDRGGAMRSVLKFARNFVHDFDKHKKSFMFLFTHANKIRDVPESLGGAKQCLLNEIILTIDGTIDDDVKNLLLFIRTCLEKGYSFVDVLHPLKSDYPSIANFIENSLKPVKVSSENGTCGLTNSSKMRLSGAVRIMLMNLRVSLRSGIVDTDEVCEIKKTFHFFDKYLQFEDMRSAVTECNDIIGDHIKHFYEVAKWELQNGTQSTGAFNKTNADILKDAHSQLVAIDPSFNMQTESNKISMEVNKFKEGLLTNIANDNFNSFSQDLQKLKVWCYFASEYQRFLDPVVDHVTTIVKQVSGKVSQFDTSRILLSSKSTLEDVFYDFKVLKSIHENARGLSSHIDGISASSEIFNGFVSRLKSNLGAWNDQNASMGIEVSFRNQDCIQGLTTRIRALEVMLTLLNGADLHYDILHFVEVFRTSIVTQVVETFAKTCARLKPSTREFDAQQLSEELTMLRDAKSIFSALEGSEWNEMDFSYAAIVDGIKSFLKAKSGELDEMSHSTLNHGLSDGARDGKALRSFAAYQWFDNFLPQEERFVQNCTTKIRYDYFREFSASADAANVIILRISSLDGDSESLGNFIEDTKELRCALPKIVEYKCFGSVTMHPKMSERAAQLFLELNTYLRCRVTYWQWHLMGWVGTVSKEENDWKKLTTSTEILNFVTSEIIEVIEMPCDESIKIRSRTAKNQILEAFSKFTHQVQRSLASPMTYEKFARLIQRVDALGEFSHTASHLPILEDLKEAARQRMSSDVKKIEEMVEQTAKFDDIDDLIANLEAGAVLLDECVSQEISDRLRLLKRLRTEKEVITDVLITEMIEKNDYTGLGNFLLPLAKSKDQIKKKRFKQYIEKIYDSVDKIDRKLQVSLSGRLTEKRGQQIATFFKIIEQVNEEAGKYMPHERFHRSIKQKLVDHKEIINRNCITLQSKMVKATKLADFVDLASLNERLSIVLRYLGPYIKVASRKKIETAISGYNELKNSISSHIKKFADSSFTKSWEIETILTRLKPTTDMNDTIFSDLAQLYARSTGALVVQLNDVLQKVKESAAEAHCYDDSIVIIHNLMRSFDKGLGRHLPQEFHDSCNVVLDELTEARKKQESDMDFEGSSVEEKLREWAEKLDRLDPSSTFYASRKVAELRTSMTYDRLKKRLNDKVGERNRRGIEALRRGEFVTVNESLNFLSRVDAIVGKHVPSASSKLEGFEKQATDSFLSICKHSQDALQSENCREFEPSFADFRGFVLNVACLTEDSNAMKSYHLTNQLVYERMCKELSLLEKTLDSFEFSAMKMKIVEVRNFGHFIADRYALLHEELKGCNHIKSDSWLDNLNKMIQKHFHYGRDLERIKFYAILGVLPSASLKEVKTAFKKMSLKCHPDKCKDESHDKFLMIKNAYDELEKRMSGRDSLSKPFDDQIRGLGNRLRETTSKALKEQHYDHLKTLLFNLHGIELIKHLVDPKLDTQKICDDIFYLAKNHVKKVRVEVDSNWSQRNYQELNHNINDLKMMQSSFISYPSIFPSSWSKDIMDSVEDEIQELGMKANDLLILSPKVPMDEFRRCFMRMGAVLVDLPLFKDYTRKVMSDVLETCLDSNVGFEFVFELGRSLQKGGEVEDEDEIRIAQNLVIEFGHFKEVLTMVWNEETIQKPPEDTVRDIRGKCMGSQTTNATSVDIEPDKLLDQYFKFDLQYTSFLGEYLNPDADRNALIQKTVGLCRNLKPVSCDHGFGDETKRALPTIMAGVFALFTVLKSGESYNRLEGDSNGSGIDAKNILMKPHNIQVLTLLCMFGCGTSSSSSLKSQLLQIRTGEGKSMILGAAATILGLLGFNVRCVCYSEYLSSRDYELFKDVCECFGLLGSINYSKIVTLSEETTAKKGDIRGLTLSLMHDKLPSSRQANHIRAIDQRARPSSVPISDSRPDPIPSSVPSSVPNFELSSDNDPIGTSISKYEASDDVSSRTRRTSSDNRKGTASIYQKSKKESKEEILLVDEVDVFFGAEFYGQTYNQVAELKEPEIACILKRIWKSYKLGEKRLRLSDIKAMSEYGSLKTKILEYDFLLENEIALMLDQVRRVDDEPFYHLDPNSDQIGYKVQDTICYNVTYGYRTVFAYLKEADSGNLKDQDTTLARVLTMPISCGQFSYANIKPKRILGVSGTLEVMSDYEKGVLQKYGVNQYLYIPSVYGKSNFNFDKVGDGVSIEEGASNFFQKITDEISKIATNEKRAVIVFFKDSKRLKEYISSAFYRKLGRKKEILTESKNANEKRFVISKAATAGQITICTAVFGRGTDFFCKDKALEKSGGVHVIQTFLSLDMSEEIQIQGRTSRQGKQGSYKLILLDKDLEDDFGIKCGLSDNWARNELYARLCDARKKSLEDKYASIDMNLSAAKKQDKATHQYFDALLGSNDRLAKDLLKELYLNMKKAHIREMDLDLAFAIDVTGSMTAYGPGIASTIQTLLTGSNSILAKLGVRFPDTEFKLRVAVLGFRDHDDGNGQFVSKRLNGNSHFSEFTHDVLQFVNTLTSSTSGGADLAEDHLGAIQHCVEWNSSGDWEGTIKAILLLTDAPAHGFAPQSTSTQNFDSYPVRHPLGLTVDSVVDKVLKKDIDLFVCSFDPISTEQFEENLSETYNEHPSNLNGREVTLIPLVPKSAIQARSANGMMGDSRKHNIFVLDESGSMQHDWAGVVSVYNKYMQSRRQRQNESDLVSVVQFTSGARVTCQLESIINAPTELKYIGGGTCFWPAALSAYDLARMTPSSHTPVIIFMSDGQADDSQAAANTFATLNDIELHVIGFRGGTDTSQLQQIARASSNGKVHTASNIDSLSKVFVQIATGGDDFAKVLEAEIGKRISEAVTNRLSAEYLGQ